MSARGSGGGEVDLLHDCSSRANEGLGAPASLGRRGGGLGHGGRRRGGRPIYRIKAVVLVSYSRRDEDLPEAGPRRSGWTVVFRKAPPANSTGRLVPGDCWIGWYSIVRTRVFLWPFGFRGSASKLCWLLISWSTLSHSMVLAENDVEGEIGGMALVVRIFLVKRNWLGVS